MPYRQWRGPGEAGSLNDMLRELFQKLSGVFSARGIKVLRQGSEGGTLTLEAPAASGLSGDIAIDCDGSSLRRRENGGSKRGVTLDLTACAAGGASRVFHSENDGGGSGLDADMVDGKHLSELPQLAQNSAAMQLDLQSGDNGGRFYLRQPVGYGDGSVECFLWRSYFFIREAQGQYRGLHIDLNTCAPGGNPLWHSGNDGLGSGMDADMVDGLHMQRGSATTGAAEADFTVSLSGFNGPPSVICQARTSAAGSVCIKTNGVTASSFMVRSNVANVPFDWVAVGV
jgi:hypothetical protein